jgi:exodeoxyribonuclease VII large subunit
MQSSHAMPARDALPAMTVSQITAQIKEILESSFPYVYVAGEISSLSKISSAGHRYFNLKDRNSILHAAMYRDALERLPCELHEGMEVTVRGRLSVYPPRGDYQLAVEELEPKGAGEQDLALRRLKERLHKLGYFAPERKRTLPAFPRRIALIASPTGAAIRDMLETLRLRWPAAEVWVLGVRVQGVEAPDSIAAAFGLLNKHTGVDAVMLGRGGGSSDDLSAFNDERVADAIFRCKFPVVSAIGHEIDVTVADLVADHRALTPTDAASRVCPDGARVLDDLRQRYRRLRDVMRARITAGRDRLRGLAERRVFRLPPEPIREREVQLDEWSDRLNRAVQQRVQLACKSVEAHAAQLESLSPLKVLGRGYSLTRTLPERQVVRSIAQAPVGAAVEIVLPDGVLAARIEDHGSPLAG